MQAGSVARAVALATMLMAPEFVSETTAEAAALPIAEADCEMPVLTLATAFAVETADANALAAIVRAPLLVRAAEAAATEAEANAFWLMPLSTDAEAEANVDAIAFAAALIVSDTAVDERNSRASCASRDCGGGLDDAGVVDFSVRKGGTDGRGVCSSTDLEGAAVDQRDAGECQCRGGSVCTLLNARFNADEGAGQ